MILFLVAATRCCGLQNKKNMVQKLRDREPRENREDRSSGVGRGGVELFRPRGVIGRGPQGP